MLNSQNVAERIKEQAKLKGVSIKKLLEDCELGANTVGKMANGTDVFSQTLAKIADYLNVSVDYLLGRTDNPEISTAAITTGDIKNSRIDNSLNINTANATNEITELFDSLTLVQRAKVIVMIDEMKKGE